MNDDILDRNPETPESFYRDGRTVRKENFEAWKAEVSKLLKHARTDSVRPKVWREQYIVNRRPERAAAAIDAEYNSGLSADERKHRLGAA
jgi:hypothetical protein